MLKISDIFLPSLIQYSEYRPMLPHLEKPCWLQDGAIGKDGEELSVHPSWPLDVRPAMNLDVALPMGSIFNFAGVSWTVCTSYSHTSFAICNATIARRRLDPENSSWETSELKVWLEEWLEYICEGLDDVSLEKERV